MLLSYSLTSKHLTGLFIGREPLQKSTLGSVVVVIHKVRKAVQGRFDPQSL
jgi:hypothetical protein